MRERPRQTRMLYACGLVYTLTSCYNLVGASGLISSKAEGGRNVDIDEKMQKH